MIHIEMIFVTPFFDTVIGSPIKEDSLVNRFSVGDTVGAHFNLVGGGFHCVL